MQEIECKGVFSITRHRKIKIKNKTPKQNKLTQAVAGTSRQHQCPSSCVVPGEKANTAAVSQHAVSTCCCTQLEKWKQSQCPCRSSSLHQWRWFQLLLLSSLVYTQWSLIQFTKGHCFLWCRDEVKYQNFTGIRRAGWTACVIPFTCNWWRERCREGLGAWETRGKSRDLVKRGRPSRWQEEWQRKEDRTDNAPFSVLTQAGRQDMSWLLS